MARYLGPKAKLSRREGTDLFLKSARRPIGDKAKFDSQARPAWPHLRHAHVRLRTAAAREAEGQAHVRRAGAPVPPLLRRGRAPQGQHRREPAAAARIAPRQRRLPHGLRLDARRSAPARLAQVHHRQRRGGQHRVVPGEARRHRGGAREGEEAVARDRFREAGRRRRDGGVGARSTRPSSKASSRRRPIATSSAPTSRKR